MAHLPPSIDTLTRPGVGPIVLRPLDVARDAALLHQWVNRPYARFWGLMGKSLAEVTAIYREQIEQRGVDARLACRQDSGEPLFLLEIYDPQTDELGRHYPVRPGDCGFHLMLAPTDAGTPGLTFQLLGAALGFLFSHPGVQRLVCEPDLRNQKIITRLLQFGFERRKVVHLPHKTGLMMSIDRARFEAVAAGPAPARPVLRHWPLRVRWHFELGRITRLWRRLTA